jgi:hypothetical protein
MLTASLQRMGHGQVGSCSIEIAWSDAEFSDQQQRCLIVMVGCQKVFNATICP